jgi:colicin V production protein
MLYLVIILVFVFFASIAMCVNEGLWNNTITLISVLICGVPAILFGPTLGVLVAEKAGKGGELLWYFVFALVWGVFALSILVFRMLTEQISGVRMRFMSKLDMFAGPIMGLFVAVVFTSFTAYTLFHIPFKAGIWDLKSASSWQQTTFQYAVAPFHNVVKNYAKAEGLESELID